MNTLKLKRHETFSIREGWIEKGINIFSKEPGCFKKEVAPHYLGLGSNMCKSLKYWLTAAQLIDFKQNCFTKIGELICRYDQYLEDDFSWWIIHINLVRNFDDAPVFSEFFNMKIQTFDKEFLINYLRDIFESKGYTLGADSSLDSDVNILLRSYYSDDVTNPEENMNCPLAKLGLVETRNKKIYKKTSPNYGKLDYRIVYYALLLCVDDGIDEPISFNLDDIYAYKHNPLNVFNISKSTLFAYLDEMKKAGMIKLNKTAGLNTIYIDKPITIEKLFKSYYKEVL